MYGPERTCFVHTMLATHVQEILFRGTSSSIWQEWSILDVTVPHGNEGKMALTVPCVAGKHLVSFLRIIRSIKKSNFKCYAVFASNISGSVERVSVYNTVASFAIRRD